VPVIGYDPLAREIRRQLNGEIPLAPSLEECVRVADLLVVANPDPAFEQLAAVLERAERAPTVIDCWRAVPGSADAALVYHGIGHGPAIGDGAAQFDGLWSDTSAARDERAPVMVG
jgi:hypothetical protein